MHLLKHFSNKQDLPEVKNSERIKDCIKLVWTNRFYAISVDEDLDVRNM